MQGLAATRALGCALLGKFENGSLIQDYLDHGAWEELMNPLWERIFSFLSCTKWSDPFRIRILQKKKRTLRLMEL